LRGVEGDEEKRLLCKLLGLDETDKTIGKVMREWWAELRILVDHEGTELQVGMIDGEPVNIEDYLKYRFALRHPQVAESRELMVIDSRKMFYLYDYDQEVGKDNAKGAVKRKAMVELDRIMQVRRDMDRVMRVMGELRPENLSTQQAQNRLQLLVENEPQKFLSIITDKNFDNRSVLTEMLQYEVLRKIGNAYYYQDQILGDNEEETILYLKNPANNSVLVTLKARMNALNRSIESMEPKAPEPKAPEPTKAPEPKPAQT
jgi:hypothetical protein